jgi:hypothetical protein
MEQTEWAIGVPKTSWWYVCPWEQNVHMARAEQVYYRKWLWYQISTFDLVRLRQISNINDTE